jgi:DNA helicase-2/ATP-dependent DNA helicase PcrA
VLGLSPDFSIYDEADTLAVLKEVAKDLNLPEPRYRPAALRAIISRCKAAGERPDDLDGSDFHGRLVQQAYEKYAAALARNQALDFDDLLLRAVELLREHPAVLARCRARFRQVLVDEYQDTNACQYQLIKLLGQEHRNVCATGDPDQSIYAWRGADVRNILAFEEDFPEAKVVRLEQNYRSTQRILEVASAVIRHNVERKEKGLWTENAPGEKVTLTVAEDGEAEAFQVAAEIRRLVDAGRSYGEVAVFYRTNAQSQPFEQALIQAGLPYQLVGGTPFYERREVKDALAYLRLIVNPADNVSFRRVINVPKRGIGAATVERLVAEAARRGVPVMAMLEDREWLERETKPKAREELSRFR